MIEDITTRVSQALDKIRPYLQQDGGGIELVEVTEDMIVKVKLVGSCHSCPNRMNTLKGGVEQFVRKEVPEIQEVVLA